MHIDDVICTHDLRAFETRLILIGAGDDDERSARLLTSDRLRQALLAGALNEDRRIIADAAIHQRPFNAIGHRGDEASEFRRHALGHVVNDRIPWQVNILPDQAV